MTYPIKPWRERLWLRVDKSGGPNACWPWFGAADSRGRGWVSVNGKRVAAHRLAYEDVIGPIPAGLHILHSCDHPPCCNPAHLRAGTHQENMDDREARGRGNRTPKRGEDQCFARLTEADVLSIRNQYAAGGISQRILANLYNVHVMTVNDVIKRRTWKHI